MQVDEALIKTVAKNARLELTPAEIAKFVPQFREILDSFSKLSKLDVSNITPSLHPVPLRNALREDVPHQCLSQEEALRNAKHQKEGYFKGPMALG
ncbi:Asp-tRNA(Asn)/Glu-tRNA(Gln) amidotransferase subunit GatC [Candidatus Woesearchaeota archaeon]|nr:Asp-tRNA(Asn)/Glu-tRNA(Gln) amidotransferase subunit GatC [Candidatus Woesearchaeota archaeon]